jgi:hypothetical protein
MWGTPEEYRSSLNAPSVREAEYEQYEPTETRFITRFNNPKLPPVLDGSGQEILGPISLPEDDLTQTEQFLMAMGGRNETEQVILQEPSFNINEQNLEETTASGPRLPVELRNVDDLPCLEELIDAFTQLWEVLPEDHPDIVNLRTAIHKVRDHRIMMSEQDDTQTEFDKTYDGSQINNVQFNPYEEAERFFDQQMQVLEKSFEELAIEPIEVQIPDVLENQAVDSEIMPDGILSDVPFIGEQPLEQIVEQEGLFEASAPDFMEQNIMPDGLTTDLDMPGIAAEAAEYDVGPAVDEINQAIDQVSQEPMPLELEPDPWQMQYDPFDMMNQMFDYRTQYMADPFQIGGGFGPLGPMPGP